MPPDAPLIRTVAGMSCPFRALSACCMARNAHLLAKCPPPLQCSSIIVGFCLCCWALAFCFHFSSISSVFCWSFWVCSAVWIRVIVVRLYGCGVVV